ncbi:MAG: hypothetical protein RLZZ621_38 [Gemmatimonadota bacterium]
MTMPRLVRRVATAAAAASTHVLAAGCQNFLDVNENPNAPQTVSPNLYLPPILHWVATSEQFDGRFIGRYTQNWTLPSGSAATPSTWDRMGYDPTSDNGGQLWRDVYWSIGQNLVDLMTKAEAEERWDLLGIGYAIKAWGWLKVTDVHGELIIKQAFDQTRFQFDYDTQEYAYQETIRLLDEAIKNLQRNDGAVSQSYLARYDRIYGGDRTKWLKFAYGLKAMTLNHFSNKSSYKPQDVIDNIDKAFVGNIDDALMPYSATSADNADGNFWGPRRGNINSYRQTRFVLGLLDGTQLGAPDPRLSRMLSPSPDGQFRAWDPNSGTLGLPTTQLPNNFFGYAGTLGAGQPSRYLFADKAKFPIMTYSQLQFIKAEAALRSGNRAVALDAYTKGVSSHIDFVNARNLDEGQTPTQITPAEKAAFLANSAIIPTASNLTLTQIMSQKYIAQWAWGHVETWTDMRRYNYTGRDPVTGNQVYPGFSTPTNLYPDNNGKIVQRIRARFNSEYVWNRASLDAIGGLALDFHTKPLWITQP